MRDKEQPARRRRGLLSPFVWVGRSVVRPLAVAEIRAQGGDGRQRVEDVAHGAKADDEYAQLGWLRQRLIFA